MLELEKIKEFWKECQEIVNRNNLDKIIVNSYIGLALSDNYYSFSRKNEINKDKDIYLIGLYEDTKLYIDKNMKYSDHRILDSNGDCLIDIKIKYGDITLF